MRKIIIVAGPTAVGKTEYAIEIAKAINGEIISCDSMQIYKYMDIGSAKPTKEELSQVKHYMIDEIDPKEEFSVARYTKMAKKYIEDLFKKGVTPVIAGGTGLYLNALLYDMDFAKEEGNKLYREYYYGIYKKKGSDYLYNLLLKKDPDSAKRIHKNNVKKVVRALEAFDLTGEGLKDFKKVTNRTSDYEVLLIGLTRNRKELYDRINKRTDILLEKGLIDEVSNLINMGFTSDDIAMKGIGYKEIIDYLNGNITKDMAIELVKRNSRHYAKRQLTWFRRYNDMKWFNLSEDKLEDILEWVEKRK